MQAEGVPQPRQLEQPQVSQRAQRAAERRADVREGQAVVKPRIAERAIGGDVFVFEAGGVTHQRAENQLIEQHDVGGQRDDRIQDRRHVLLRQRFGDIGTDAGQFDRAIADRNGFGGHQGEPGGGLRHHGVPQQARHRIDEFQPPEALPRVVIEAAGGFIQLLGTMRSV